MERKKIPELWVSKNFTGARHQTPGCENSYITEQLCENTENPRVLFYLTG